MGSNPTPSATFPINNKDSVPTEHQLNNFSQGEELIPPIKPVCKTVHLCELGAVSEPFLVKHGHLEARIIYAPSDGLYHAYYSVGGKRVSKAAKTLELAESRIRKSMKLACRGQISISTMSEANLERLNTAVAVLDAEGFNDPLTVANQYVNFKRMAEGGDIAAAISFYKESFQSIKRVPFSEAADCWLKFRKARWASDTLKEKLKRVHNVVSVFQIDVCDMNHEILEHFFVCGSVTVLVCDGGLLLPTTNKQQTYNN